MSNCIRSIFENLPMHTLAPTFYRFIIEDCFDVEIPAKPLSEQ